MCKWVVCYALNCISVHTSQISLLFASKISDKKYLSKKLRSIALCFIGTQKYEQSLKMNKNCLLNKPYVNGVILIGKNLSLNASSLLIRQVINREGLDLSKEVLWVSLSHRAAKILSVKLWWWSHHPGVEARTPAFGLTPAERQDFFRSSTLTTCSFAVL